MGGNGALILGKPDKDKGYQQDSCPHPQVARNLGRFNKTRLTFDVAAHLIDAGVETPAVAVSYGPDVVLSMIVDEDQKLFVEGFFEVATPVLKGSTGLLSEIIGNFRGPAILGQSRLEIGKEVHENLPTLRGLFGDLDECACRPCESVLGLPAYFVDLLNLLKKTPAVASDAIAIGVPTALQVLTERRPDVYDLQLTCENAETELPYIDLALEVLENAIGLPAPIIIPVNNKKKSPASLLQPEVDRRIIAALSETVTWIGASFRAQAPQFKGKASSSSRWFVDDGIHRWTLLVPNSNPAWGGNIEVQIVGLTYLRSSPGQDLKVAPENRNRAYQKLARAPFPGPFRSILGCRKRGTFLKSLALPGTKLLKLTSSDLSDDLTAEMLGLSREQAATANASADWELISRARTGSDLWTAWGLVQPGDPVPNSVTVLIRSWTSTFPAPRFRFWLGCRSCYRGQDSSWTNSSN
ncbi:MAG: hypothetical protein IPG76_00340 [Acidobacteria bacterium]|nr:hypothetical protein [Acidobacteriota bacterium]